METSQFKDNVKNAAEYLERAGLKVPHTQLLEAISRAFGERNWSTMRALLENPPTPAPSSAAEPEEEDFSTWDPKQGPMPDGLFVKHGGNCCPVCGGRDLDSDAPDADGPDAWDETECENCGSTYNTDYTITGYRLIKLGSGAPMREDVINDIVEDVQWRARKHEYSIHSEDNAQELASESSDQLGVGASAQEIAEAAKRLLS